MRPPSFVPRCPYLCVCLSVSEWSKTSCFARRLDFLPTQTQLGYR